MKLRLLFTEMCNRDCPGCCNKDWDLKALPPVEPQDFVDAEEVIITGGEPMLFPEKVVKLIRYIRIYNPKQTIYMYTAKVDDWLSTLYVLRKLDGICVTLHEQDDVMAFNKLNIMCHIGDLYRDKSLRLNIFKGVQFWCLWCADIWKIKNDIVWQKNCPLPENEVFKRIGGLDYNV